MQVVAAELDLRRVIAGSSERLDASAKNMSSCSASHISDVS
jgi:hypothetical protein